MSCCERNPEQKDPWCSTQCLRQHPEESWLAGWVGDAVAGHGEEHRLPSSCWCCGPADILELDPSGRGAAPQAGGMCSSVVSGGLEASACCQGCPGRALGMGRAKWPLQGPPWRNPVGKFPRGKRDPRELGNIQRSLLPGSVTSLWTRNGAKGAGELQGWTWNSVRRDNEVEEGPG